MPFTATTLISGTSAAWTDVLTTGVVLPSSVTRVYATTPGTPKDRVRILQKAFSDTLKDPEFVAEAKKAQLEIDPLTGEEVGKAVSEMFDLSPGLQAKLKDMLSAK